MNITIEDKRPLQKMFLSVPPSYDLLNRILTLRFDQIWRKIAARICLENQPVKVLDLCSGTGDLIIYFGTMSPAGTSLTALDYSMPMLDLAKKKAARRGLTSIEFIHGDVASMPFPDGHFDSVGIAFAFRNLTFHNPDRDRFLSEILRVIKPGGRFVIVETSQPKNMILRKLFHLYLRYITAPVGGILSGHYGAYKYLAHSARLYHNIEELEELLHNAGFTAVRSNLLLGGIAGIYIAEKPRS